MVADSLVSALLGLSSQVKTVAGRRQLSIMKMRIEDRGSKIEDRGLRIEDGGSKVDSILKSSILDPRSSILKSRLSGENHDANPPSGPHRPTNIGSLLGNHDIWPSV